MANFFKKIAPYAAGALAGGVLGSFGKTAPYAAAGSAAAGALTNSKNRLAGAAQGAVGGAAGGALAGGVKGLFNNTGFGSGAMSGLKSYGSSIPGFGGVGTSNPTGVLAKFLTPQSIQNPGAAATKQLGGMALKSAGTQNFSKAPWAGNTVSAPRATAAAAGAPAGGGLVSSFMPQQGGGIGKQSLFDKFGTSMGGMLPGMAVSMLGNAMAPEVSDPNFESAIAPYRSAVQNGGADPEARALGMGELKRVINTPIGGSSANGMLEAKRINEQQKAEALKQNAQVWKAAMGSQDPTQNSEYQKSMQKIIQDYDAQFASQSQALQFQYDQQQQTQRMQAAQQALGLDSAQMEYLAQLAGLDLQTIMYQTGLEAGEAAEFKDMFNSIGTSMMQNAQDANDPYRQALTQLVDKQLAAA